MLPAEATNGIVKFVDVNTRENPPAQATANGNMVVLKAFRVAVVEVK